MFDSLSPDDQPEVTRRQMEAMEEMKRAILAKYPSPGAILSASGKPITTH